MPFAAHLSTFDLGLYAISVVLALSTIALAGLIMWTRWSLYSLKKTQAVTPQLQATVSRLRVPYSGKYRTFVDIYDNSAAMTILALFCCSFWRRALSPSTLTAICAAWIFMACYIACFRVACTLEKMLDP